MGKGTIVSNEGDGRYTVELNYNRDQINTWLANLQAQVTALTTRIADEEAKAEPDATKLRLMRLQKMSCEKRIEFLEGNSRIPEDDTVSAWCADLTDNLSVDDEVGTIEIGRERASGINIQPGYEGGASYAQARDGQLFPLLGTTPAATYYNLAMLPGAQKWKPMYRYGRITSIDHASNRCDIDLESLESSQQSIDINQATTLASVPIDYMDCDSAAFATNDDVIVKFQNEDFADPKVVGFKDHPQACYRYLTLTIGPLSPPSSYLWDNGGGIAWNMSLGTYATVTDGSGNIVSQPCSIYYIWLWQNQHTLVSDMAGGDAGGNDLISFSERYATGAQCYNYIMAHGGTLCHTYPPSPVYAATGATDPFPTDEFYYEEIYHSPTEVTKKNLQDVNARSGRNIQFLNSHGGYSCLKQHNRYYYELYDNDVTGENYIDTETNIEIISPIGSTTMGTLTIHKDQDNPDWDNDKLWHPLTQTYQSEVKYGTDLAVSYPFGRYSANLLCQIYMMNNYKYEPLFETHVDTFHLFAHASIYEDATIVDCRSCSRSNAFEQAIIDLTEWLMANNTKYLTSPVSTEGVFPVTTGETYLYFYT